MGHTRSFSDPSASSEKTDKVETVIPSSRTGSTRPTHNGIAYPFRLKVPQTEQGDRNSSIITLDSDGEGDGDGEGTDRAHKDEATKISHTNGIGSEATESEKGDVVVKGEGKNVERPPIERFVTAAELL